MNDLAAPPSYHQDRTAALIIFGILEIGLALLFLVMLAFVGIAALAAGASSAAPQAPNARAMIGAGLFYLLLAAFFATMGIGTLLGRRWARTLMLVCSWIWLVVGIFSTVMMIFILPKVLTGMQDAGQLAAPETGINSYLTGCMFTFLGLFYIVFPAILVLFYRSPNVKATFEARDPSIPWTDRTPAPVLALSLMLGYVAVASLVGLNYGVLPVFGRILTGAPAALGFIILAVLCAALAVEVYQRRPVGWWGAVAFWALGCLSGFFFLGAGGFDMRGLYEAMGINTPEIERMHIYEIWRQRPVLIMMILVWLAWLGYLIWVRKFFRPAKEISEPFA